MNYPFLLAKMIKHLAIWDNKSEDDYSYKDESSMGSDITLKGVEYDSM